jgi:hypothetical protein
MVTLENVLILGVALIILTFLANAGTDIIEYVDRWVRLLLGS